MKKKVVTFGEILMRLTTNNYKRFLQANEFEVNYGGTEANVAIALSNWGVPSTHVSVVPDNDLGQSASNYLQQYGVNTDHIYTNEGRIGLYFLESGAMQRPSKIIYDRFDSAFANYNSKLINWYEILDDVEWLHWTGITAAVSENAAQMCLDALTIAQQKGITVSGDINYRRNLWQYGKTPLEIMPNLIEKTNVIVSGLIDFENCVNINEKDYLKTCEKVASKYPSVTHITTTHRNTVNSSHNKLSGILWHKGDVYESNTYDMTHIVDRIGGGDAYMAGLIYGVLHLDNLNNALEFAVASSVLKHSVPGDANLVSLNEVKQLAEGKNVGKLLR